MAEDFAPGVDCGGSDGEGRALRFLEWTWQRAGETDRYVVDYTIVMREGEGPPVIVNDRHEEGLFPRASWMRLLREVGFEPHNLRQPYEERLLDLFLARVPGG